MSDLSAFAPEKGRSRCGDSYQDVVTVSGEVDGHGRDLVDSIRPVFFLGGMTPDPDRVQMRGDELEEAMMRVQDRIDDLREYIDLESHWIGKAIDNPAGFTWLLKRAQAELDRVAELEEYGPALPGAGSGPDQETQTKMRKRLIEALKVLRCAQYWAVKARLTGEALETMPARPVGGWALKTEPDPKELWLPDGPVLPPLPTDLPDPVIPEPSIEPERVGSTVAEPEPSNPMLKWGALAVAGVGLYMLAKR